MLYHLMLIFMSRSPPSFIIFCRKFFFLNHQRKLFHWKSHKVRRHLSHHVSTYFPTSHKNQLFLFSFSMLLSCLNMFPPAIIPLKHKYIYIYIYYLIHLVLKSHPDSAAEASSRYRCCFSQEFESLEAVSLSCNDCKLNIIRNKKNAVIDSYANERL